jgi:hypothetical protein
LAYVEYLPRLGLVGLGWRPILDISIFCVALISMHVWARQVGIVARSISDRLWVRLWAAISAIVLIVSVVAGPNLMDAKVEWVGAVSYILWGWFQGSLAVGPLGLPMWLVMSIFGRLVPALR